MPASEVEHRATPAIDDLQIELHTEDEALALHAQVEQQVVAPASVKLDGDWKSVIIKTVTGY